MSIRPALETDLPPIAVLEEQLFAATAWPPALIREELTGPHRRYLVAEQEGRVVGYGGVLTLGQDADIQTLAVDPAVQGQGVGTALLDRLLTHAHEVGATRVFLEVRADNDRAYALYAHAGFALIGTRPGYYQPDGIDAQVMRLDLSAYMKAQA